MLKKISFLMFGISVFAADDSVKLDLIQVQDMYSALEERKDQSIAKRIIKAEELIQYGDLNALELLKRTPGVSVSDGKIGKSQPGKGYTTVLVDGEEVSTGSKRSRSPLEQISPDMIERIEIMTNSSAEYTAEAMGGIVNIILKKPKVDGRTIAKVSTGSYGNLPIYNAFVQHEKKEGNWSYMVNSTYSENRTNDLNSSYSNYGNKASQEDILNSYLTLNSKIIYKPSNKEKYQFDAMGTYGQDKTSTNQINTLTNSVTNILNNDNNTSKVYWLKASGENHLSSVMILDWKLISHANKQNENTTSINSGSLSTQENSNNMYMNGGDINLSYLEDRHFLKTGLFYRSIAQNVNTNILGVSSTYSNITQDKYAAYIQDEWSLNDAAILTPGLRYEATKRNVDNLSTFSYFAPSVHFLYKVSQNDNIRLSVAKTVRLPKLQDSMNTINRTLSLNDINHPDTVGNPSLVEEHATNYEVKYEHFFNDKGMVGASSFYRTISNKIEKFLFVDQNGRYIEQPFNAGEGKIYGIEVELKKQVPSITDGFNVWGNLLVLHSELTNPNNNFSGVIAETPSYTANFGFDHPIYAIKTTYGFVYKRNGGYQDPMDQEQIIRQQKGYDTLDFYATKRLNSSYKLTLNVKNLTQTQIQTYTYNTASAMYQNDKERSRTNFLLTLEGKF